MLHIDSDNALGSPSGDVDDAFAIAALLTSGVAVTGLSACSGNTTAERAYANNVRLAALLGFRGAVMHKPDLAAYRGRIVALGPLTNVARARDASEIIIVGGNSVSRGRWPPIWPYEFNLVRDRRATLEVFHSGAPLTIFPLNVARTLTVRREDLGSLAGETGAYLRRESQRWFAHLLRVRLTRHFPMYDLAAALYAIDPEGFLLERTTALMHANTAFRFGRGSRPVTLCVGLDRNLLWRRFVAALGDHHARSARD